MFIIAQTVPTDSPLWFTGLYQLWCSVMLFLFAAAFFVAVARDSRRRR